MIKFYASYNKEHKKKIKEALLRVSDNRKTQIKLIENSIIKAMKDSIKANDEFLKNRLDFESLMLKQTQISEYIISYKLKYQVKK